MMMKRAALVALCVLAGFAGGALRAQQRASEARGKVKDGSDKGIPGVKITITNTKHENLTYSGTTDKRGDFWFGSLVYDEAAPQWRLTSEKEGYVPLKVRVEVRTSRKELANEFETKIGRDNPSIEFNVKAFGEVRIELTLVPADEVPEVAAVNEVPAISGAAAPGQAAAADPYALARQRLEQEDFQGSVDLLQKAVEAAPDDPERREVCAWVLNKLGRTAEAEAQAVRATELAPNRASAQLLLGDLHAARGDYARAAEAFQKAKALEPENVKVIERLAWVAEVTGKTEEAIAANEAVVKLSPQNVAAWMSLGDLYHRKGRPDRAEAAYKKVVELDPGNAYKTFFNLGALIENRPNLTEVDNRKTIEAFRKAIEIKSDYAVAHRHLAYALLRAGDLEGAKKELETYLTLAPEAPDAREIREILVSLGGKPASATKKK